MSVLQQAVQRDPFAELSRFRADFYTCLTGRRDALLELTDALLCTEGPVKTLVDPALASEHRRGHGALYGALKRLQGTHRARPSVASRPRPCRGRAIHKSTSATHLTRLPGSVGRAAVFSNVVFVRMTRRRAPPLISSALQVVRSPHRPRSAGVEAERQAGGAL